jgi:AcrR family transcriptional regulator
VTLHRKSEGIKRTYRSPRRAAQAEATRRAILDAAHRMFLENGYPATSIRAIARAAEVSDQTVYNIFGDKPSLLVAVGDRVIAGEAEPEGPPGRNYEAELRAASNDAERVELAAAWSRTVWEGGMLRFESMLLDAGAHDARAAAVAESVWQRKYDENRALFAAVFAGSVRAEDDFDEAYDVFFALNSAAFVRVLIDDRGWTFDTYERWTATMLRRLFTGRED